MGVTVSVVSPVYRGEATVEEFARGVLALADDHGIDLELVLVDDASPDRSWEAITQVSAGDPRVVGVRLGANVRQTRATFAGFAAARGDVVVAMDSDLEHPPGAVLDLLATHAAGCDLVLATRRRAGAGPTRRAGAAALNAVSALLGLPVGDIGSSLLLMDRAVEARSRQALERTGLHLLLPAMWDAADRPATVAVDLRDAGPSSYPVAALAGIGGRYLAHHLAERLARPGPSAAVVAAGAAVGVVGRRRGARRWWAAPAASVGLLLVAARVRRPRGPGPLYEVAEVIDRRD